MRKSCVIKIIDICILEYLYVLPVIESCMPYGFFRDAEAQRVYQMQPCPSCGTCSCYVPRVLWNLGLEKTDVKHMLVIYFFLILLNKEQGRES